MSEEFTIAVVDPQLVYADGKKITFLTMDPNLGGGWDGLSDRDVQLIQALLNVAQSRLDKVRDGVQ